MCPDCEKHLLDACDAAALRLAFNEAVRLFQAVHSTTPFPRVYEGAWGAFYNAVRDTEAGRGILKELVDAGLRGPGRYTPGPAQTA